VHRLCANTRSFHTRDLNSHASWCLWRECPGTRPLWLLRDNRIKYLGNSSDRKSNLKLREHRSALSSFLQLLGLNLLMPSDQIWPVRQILHWLSLSVRVVKAKGPAALDKDFFYIHSMLLDAVSRLISEFLTGPQSIMGLLESSGCSQVCHPFLFDEFQDETFSFIRNTWS
jgi:hypothetical protein